jgi:hypothetical protein
MSTSKKGGKEKEKKETKNERNGAGRGPGGGKSIDWLMGWDGMGRNKPADENRSKVWNCTRKLLLRVRVRERG